MVSKQKQNRLAFTMIELIFAIVVISISVMSLPMITQVTFKAIDEGLVQEAIFASVAGINEATTYRWDEHSMDDKLIDPVYSRVINTGGCTGSPSKRPGHINRQCVENFDPFLVVPPYTDSLNVAAHGSQSIYSVGGSTSAAGYKKDYNSTLIVNANANFGATLGNPDMKEIIITILDANDASIVTLLKAYSANIGEVQYANTVYP